MNLEHVPPVCITTTPQSGAFPTRTRFRQCNSNCDDSCRIIISSMSTDLSVAPWQKKGSASFAGASPSSGLRGPRYSPLADQRAVTNNPASLPLSLHPSPDTLNPPAYMIPAYMTTQHKHGPCTTGRRPRSRPRLPGENTPSMLSTPTETRNFTQVKLCDPTATDHI